MKILIRTLLAAGLLAWAFPASATVISFVVVDDDEKNDCAGYYSNPNNFSSCIIFAEDLGQGDGDISSVVAKWDNETGGWEVSDLYTDDFSTSWVTGISTGEGGSGTFTYGGDDDLIRYWVAKGAAKAGFKVFYDTDDATCTDANASTYACMITANFITKGTTWDWSTATGQGLSHLTFYDTEIREMSEPGTLALFGIGLIALGALRRRRTT